MEKQKLKKTGKLKQQNKSEINQLLFIGGILLFTLFIFFPSLKNGFTNWDDPSLIMQNPLITEFSVHNIKRIFTEIYFANYQPLHLLSYSIEHSIFGLNPTGYHVVSLLMHLINVILVYFIVKLLSKGNIVIALLTAFVWAVNPLRTESVCWAAERKDMLYSMFFFAALICYLIYVKNVTKNTDKSDLKQKDNQAKIKYIIFAFIFFVLSVFSKTMAVSLVPVLFLVDFYFGRKFNLKSILEKIPFFILAIVMGLISIYATKKEGVIDTLTVFSFVDRLFFASHNLLMYIIKSVIPFSQSAYYAYPVKTGYFLSAKYYIAAVCVVALTVYIIYTAKKKKLLFFTTGYFVATVFLVLMIIPVGPTIFSERYSYIPSVALFFLIALTHEKFIAEKRKYRFPVLLMVSLYIIVTSIVTFNRCKIWKDGLSLWTDAVQEFPTAPHALNNLGDAYFNNGKINEAIQYFTAAIKNDSSYAQAWSNRGNAYGQSGKAKEAFSDLSNAIRLDPAKSEAYNRRGQANAVLGNIDSSLVDFNTALKIKPDFTEVFYNLGITYYNINKKDIACENFRKAVAMGFENAKKPLRELCK